MDQRLLRQVIDSLPLGVALVDRNGDIVLANPGSTRLWGRLIRSGPDRYEKSKGFWHDSGKPVAPDEWPSRRAVTRGETVLGDLGLGQALQWYATREARRAGLELVVNVADVDGRLPAQVETACFRLVQEALTNVVRHSAARRVEVALSTSTTAIHVEVRDDGKGFQVGAAREVPAGGKSQGLSNMQERAELRGGALTIESAPGQGTAIRASFPISPETAPP